MTNKTLLAVLLLFTGLNIFLSFNYHSHGSRHTYHGALWADRAGYFVYLPALYQHRFNGCNMPQGLDTLTGNGFSIDQNTCVVRAKYTSGVSLLLLPFYGVAHFIGWLSGADNSSFGPIDHAVVQVAAPVYLVFGSTLLFLLVRRRYSNSIAAVSALVIFAGTNLFFYTIGDPGMSHVYSFFLFSSLLIIVDRYNERNTSPTIDPILLGLIIGLIILVRPTNALFIALCPFLFSTSISHTKSTLQNLIKWDTLKFAIPAALLVWVPQLIYWNYAFGSYITWPYTGEGFTNWSSPELMKFWFSTNNGLVPYAPTIIPTLVGLWAMGKQGQTVFAIATLAMIFLLSYSGSSWWVWHFGCGLGSRTFVEYWAILIFPLAAAYQLMQKHLGKVFPALFMLGLVIFQLKITYSYGNCWFSGDWDWQAYRALVFGPTK